MDCGWAGGGGCGAAGGVRADDWNRDSPESKPKAHSISHFPLFSTSRLTATSQRSPAPAIAQLGLFNGSHIATQGSSAAPILGRRVIPPAAAVSSALLTSSDTAPELAKPDPRQAPSARLSTTARIGEPRNQEWLSARPLPASRMPGFAVRFYKPKCRGSNCVSSPLRIFSTQVSRVFRPSVQNRRHSRRYSITTSRSFRFSNSPARLRFGPVMLM